MKGNGPLDREKFEQMMADTLSAKKPHITAKALIREPGFAGRRAGETHAFTKQRQKNRARNKAAKASRKRK